MQAVKDASHAYESWDDFESKTSGRRFLSSNQKSQIFISGSQSIMINDSLFDYVQLKTK